MKHVVDSYLLQHIYVFLLKKLFSRTVLVEDIDWHSQYSIVLALNLNYTPHYAATFQSC